MLPLKDRNPTSRFAVLTAVIIAANVGVFFFWQNPFPSGEQAQEDQAVFFYCQALVPWEVTHGKPLADGGTEAVEAIQRSLDPDNTNPGVGREVVDLTSEACPNKSVWVSLFTAMFLHGGLLHIGGNMLFLWVFGNNVEDKVGLVRYALFYLVCGFAASGAHILSDANSAIPVVGASGAIAGVLGAYLVMFPRRRVLTLLLFYFITTVELPAFVLLGFWFVLQFLPILQELGGAGSGVTDVAVWAHIGGFAAGALIAFLMFPREKGDPHAYERRPIL
ncbi:MAG: rhomboid family intramembrane serine protease [Actinomycetota bacterium]